MTQNFPTGLTLARVLAAVRWANAAWILAIVVVADNQDATAIVGGDPSGVDSAFRRPVVAWLCVIAVAALCVWGTVQVRRGARSGMTRAFAITEGVVALALSAIDGWVFEPGHVFETSQSLAAQAPLIAAASIGFAFGPAFAAGFGVLVGPFEWWAARLNDFGPLELRHWTSIVASSLFFAVVGAVFGWFVELLRRAEETIADQRARDEVADVLHDTVLQTLAVVEQRTAASDPDLARSARRADRDLRRFLFGAAAHSGDDLEHRIRSAVERAADEHRQVGIAAAEGVSLSVSVIDLGCDVSDRGQRALAGAVGEAVVNAYKHASASRIVVFVETDDNGAVFASIHDDGVGFDPATVRERGLARSIRSRLAAVGGRAEVESRPGAGTDVRLWVT